MGERIAIFTKKNKLKCKIFNDKNVYKQNYFSVITKNTNWKVLTKNLGTLKDKMNLRVKSFNILGVHWKIQLLGEGVHKKLM